MRENKAAPSANVDMTLVLVPYSDMMHEPCYDEEEDEPWYRYTKPMHFCGCVQTARPQGKQFLSPAFMTDLLYIQQQNSDRSKASNMLECFS